MGFVLLQSGLNHVGQWILITLVASGMVGIPTIGIYREASENSDRPDLWTGAMFLVSIGFPVIGPLLLWILPFRFEAET